MLMEIVQWHCQQTDCQPEIITALHDETRRLMDAPDSEEERPSAVPVSEWRSEERPSVFWRRVL